ncbi:DinB family protein [Streptomyces sp. NBC_01498]|uniref:DinB family protein n=1 Tax=Streptomyces sp. NBC_01498 TaxID=2975870 RepID=UPI002E7B0DB6|nr:DinB family protein [Streptomyces sp. NBC_01498]WTL26423.1 DinB family protein [Streptomyces sp. NBC_01498]
MVEENDMADQQLATMKADLVRYLQSARDSLLWKLDGLSEYDARRPLTPTGTNLLGLVKHAAAVELGYFGDTFGRPYFAPDEVPAWYGEEAEANADMWATAEESREEIVGLYRAAWAHADRTITDLPLDAVGVVPWWPADRAEATLHRLLVHMIAETDRHAGHADIVRELIDGAVGLREDRANLPPAADPVWGTYHDRVESAARRAGGED